MWTRDCGGFYTSYIWRMDLIVITSPEPVPEESRIIREIIEAGAWKIHLRKPTLDLNGIEKLLDQIPAALHKQLVTYDHLIPDAEIGGIHFRKGMAQNAQIEELKARGICTSTSVHSFEEVFQEEDYDYLLIGPLFRSLSKPGYGPGPLGSPINSNVRLFALGGIDEKNIAALDQKIFSGAAILGAIWQDKDPVEKFRMIKKSLDSL